MRKLADSCGLIVVSKLRRSGVNVVGSLFISSPVVPTSGFYYSSLGTNHGLYPVCTSPRTAFAQRIFGFNRLIPYLYPTIHRTNSIVIKKYN